MGRAFPAPAPAPDRDAYLMNALGKQTRQPLRLQGRPSQRAGTAGLGCHILRMVRAEVSREARSGVTR